MVIRSISCLPVGWVCYLVGKCWSLARPGREAAVQSTIVRLSYITAAIAVQQSTIVRLSYITAKIAVQQTTIVRLSFIKAEIAVQQ